MNDKFLYISEGPTDGTLLAQDGGVAIIWHNGEHIIGQCYKERLDAEELKLGFIHAYTVMNESSSDSALFDFTDEENVLPAQIQEMADWLVSPREGDFWDNLTFLDSELSEEEVNEKVKSFLDNDKFKY